MLVDEAGALVDFVVDYHEEILEGVSKVGGGAAAMGGGRRTFLVLWSLTSS